MPTILAEYLRAILVKRRWLVMSSPTMLVGIVTFSVRFAPNWLMLPDATRTWEPPWWLWIIAIFIGFGLAQFLAWREEHGLRATQESSHAEAIAERLREIQTVSSLVTSTQSRYRLQIFGRMGLGCPALLHGFFCRSVKPSAL